MNEFFASDWTCLEALLSMDGSQETMFHVQLKLFLFDLGT